MDSAWGRIKVILLGISLLGGLILLAWAFLLNRFGLAGTGVLLVGALAVLIGVSGLLAQYRANRPGSFDVENAAVIRPALFALRGELDSARRLLDRANERDTFWDPELEHLPAEKWDEFNEVLSSSRDLWPTYDLVEAAYQECNRLNQHLRTQVRDTREEMESNQGFISYGRGYEFTMDDADKVQVSGVRDSITMALASITEAINAL